MDSNDSNLKITVIDNLYKVIDYYSHNNLEEALKFLNLISQAISIEIELKNFKKNFEKLKNFYYNIIKK